MDMGGLCVEQASPFGGSPVESDNEDDPTSREASLKLTAAVKSAKGFCLDLSVPSPNIDKRSSSFTTTTTNTITTLIKPSITSLPDQTKEDKLFKPKHVPPRPVRIIYRTASGRRLHILNHQVAGQAPLLKLEGGRVCKPLAETEWMYYETLKADNTLTDSVCGNLWALFLPKYFGSLVLKQEFQYLDKEKEKLGAAEQCSNNSTSSNSSSSSSVSGEDEIAVEAEEKAQLERLSTFINREWETKFYLKNMLGNKPTHIILEDLTWSYRRPCILDLKLGVRQHGKNSPPDKVHSQIEKCAKTTSASLGYRLCGLQVYNTEEGEYMYKDKYYGRKLSPSNIAEPFRLFFADAQGNLRRELLESVVGRIEALLRCMQELGERFTWFGSSLLFIYEGQQQQQQQSQQQQQQHNLATTTNDTPQPPTITTTTTTPGATPKFDLKMVDFAKTYRREDILRDECVADIDDGCTLGLRNLVALFTSILSPAS
eukprot:TRINITY_DN1255_c0_g1_i3.p1 TRINITY_DN1255_c0_g1~~TRINITY_DN1255_c0_g1_i3.p1  ORF type:complete len:485 (+),score=124.48 TRINITY_DN1255_c0_g1_i3:202-1656(+)